MKPRRLGIDLVQQSTNALVLETFNRVTAGARKTPANIHRTLANSPNVFSSFISFAHALRFQTELDPAERELAILRVLEWKRGDYELHHHRRMALQAGVSEQAIEAVKEAIVIEDTVPDGVFGERQVALLRYADQLTAGNGIDADVEAGLRKHYDNRQIVELSLTMAFYLGIAHFTNALEVPQDI